MINLTFSKPKHGFIVEHIGSEWTNEKKKKIIELDLARHQSVAQLGCYDMGFQHQLFCVDESGV